MTIRSILGGKRGVDSAQAGFSLIEILVAVTIMGLAYVAILQNFSMSARNIANMEEGRSALLATSLAFEQTLLSMAAASQPGGESGGEVLVEGGSYQVVSVTDDTGEFTTLQLRKK